MSILRLSGCGLGTLDVSKLAAGLQYLRNLQELSLACNNIGDSGIQSLSHAIAQCSALEALDLSASIQTRTPGGQELTYRSALPGGQGVIGHIGAEILAAALIQVFAGLLNFLSLTLTYKSASPYFLRAYGIFS
jgi:hypothetical protein